MHPTISIRTRQKVHNSAWRSWNTTEYSRPPFLGFISRDPFDSGAFPFAKISFCTAAGARPIAKPLKGRSFPSVHTLTTRTRGQQRYKSLPSLRAVAQLVSSLLLSANTFASHATRHPLLSSAMLAKSIAAFLILAISLSGMVCAHGSHEHDHDETHAHNQHRRHFDSEDSLVARYAELPDEVSTRMLERELRRRGGGSSTLRVLHCKQCSAEFETRAALVSHHSSKHAKDYGTMSERLETSD
ncbi:hypothetical protein LshimejAT787_1205260 [Lyophyllum shimeji]|uniref:C2H2-type domain-containing protein n=1 Tax=Lyophyllum shimeji TaxID=47721 RepID=A0A9P3USB9_LYOSH|nr:hypothetical protein LshimejAT787_1205260 [Lyophyllum shimeji]